MGWDDLSWRLQELHSCSCSDILAVVNDDMANRADARAFTYGEYEYLRDFADRRRQARVRGARELFMQLDAYLKYAFELHA